MASKARDKKRKVTEAKAAVDASGNGAVEGGEVAPADIEQTQSVDGVLVVIQYLEDGGCTTDVRPVGATRVTEIPTVLELGLAGFRERVGLGLKRP